MIARKIVYISQSSVYDLVADWDGYRGVGRPSFNVKTIRINSYFPPIFWVKFLFFSYFFTLKIPIFLFF